MSFPIERRTRWVERLRDLAETDAAKLVLSTLIILSVMPRLGAYSVFFFFVFALELLSRIVILRDKLREGEFDRTEVILLVVDFFAILSFLPLEPLFKARFLRLARLSRMLMLIGYWKPIGREIWIIVMKRERRYQLVFVGSSVVILTLSAAILLYHLRSFGIDFNGNGTLTDDRTPDFWTLVWWAFRQLQDPGNLLSQPSLSLVFAVSLLLTMAGIFLMAFLIGIGTTVVEELVSVGRERPLGFRGHSVIANLGPHSRTLVEELVAYYAKSFRSPRLVTMGSAPSRYDYMYTERLRRVRYRQGAPSIAHDLTKVDAGRARRVILLGKAGRDGSDAEVISQILSVREANPHTLIFAELFDSDNIDAALAAGGNTVPILTNHFLALLQAQIIASPGSERVYSELLSTHGHEIYTCVFGSGALGNHPAPPPDTIPSFASLLQQGHMRHGVVLLGMLDHARDTPQAFRARLNPRSTVSPQAAQLAGFFGIAANFEQLKQATLDPQLYREAPVSETSGERPSFTFAREKTVLNKVLICGMNDGLIELCDQLSILGQQTELYVLVSSPQQQRDLLDLFLARTQARGGNPPFERLGLRCRYASAGPSRLRYELGDQGTLHGHIHVLVADWSDERSLTAAAEGYFDLSEIEAVVYTYETAATDPDARTALGLFKLLRLAKQNPSRLHKRLRVFCAIRNEPKAALFERRFANQPSESEELHVTVLPIERLRNAFIAQSVFVPGISAIYDALLCEKTQPLCRLVVQRCPEPQRDIDFGELTAELSRHNALVPLAIELSTASGEQLVVNPLRESDAYRFPAGLLCAVYAIGEPPTDADA
jgi:hypothetical protein